MRDARTAQIDPGDPAAAPAVLRQWVLYVWDERFDDAALDQPDYRARRAALPTAVEPAAVWLARQMDWLTRREVVIDLFDELRSLHAQLRSIGSRRRPIGACPNMVDDGGSTRRCGSMLYAPRTGDCIRCYACGQEWPRAAWLRLGDLLSTVD
jgi:hypothetical protein